MSRYLGGGFTDPEIEVKETVFTKEEIIESQIQDYLSSQEAEQEEIKDTYRRFIQ